MLLIVLLYKQKYALQIFKQFKMTTNYEVANSIPVTFILYIFHSGLVLKRRSPRPVIATELWRNGCG